MVQFGCVSGSIDTRNNRLAIVNISLRSVCINDDTVTSIYDAMVEVEEALGFPIAHHKTTVWVCAADFRRFRARLIFLTLQGLFPSISLSFVTASFSCST